MIRIMPLYLNDAKLVIKGREAKLFSPILTYLRGLSVYVIKTVTYCVVFATRRESSSKSRRIAKHYLMFKFVETVVGTLQRTK